MVSVCLPSDALLQHLPSYLGFSYLGHGVSPHGCSSKVQLLLLTLDTGYLITATFPDPERGVAPLSLPAPVQLLLLRRGVALLGRLLSLRACGSVEFQRIARRDKKAFLSDQCKEIEENNRMGKTSYLFKTITDTKGKLHAKMGSTKDRNCMDLT